MPDNMSPDQQEFLQRFAKNGLAGRTVLDGTNMAEMSAEQHAFLQRFATNGLAGRRVMCFFAHCMVGLGMVFGAVGGVTGGVIAVMKFWQMQHGGQ